MIEGQYNKIKTMEEKALIKYNDKSLFKYNGKTYKLIKQPKEGGKSCRDFCSLHNFGCEKLCVKAYNSLDNPDFGLIEAVFVEVDESENEITKPENNMKENEIDWKKLYEEEHEKYEGALERARGHHSVASHYDKADEIQELEHIFPELKESEDERIRKEMIDYLYKQGESVKYRFKDWIAWLKKQGEQKPVVKRVYQKFNIGDTLCRKGWAEHTVESIYDECEDPVYVCRNDDGEESHIAFSEQDKWSLKHDEQKPADKAEPKFKVGDWVVDKQSNILYVKNIYDSYYNVVDEQGRGYNYDIQPMNADCHLWTIQDTKDGDVLANKNGAIFINAGSSKNGGTLDCYCYISVQGEFYIEEHKTGSWFYKVNIKPATKEQRELLFSKMKEAGYEWDEEKKELKKIEQKSAWSEEDERVLDNILCSIDNGEWLDIYQVNWLKSLKDRIVPQSKQEWSEEDIVKLNDVIRMIENSGNVKSIIEHYTNWLKSLKDRVVPQNTWKPTEEQIDALLNVLHPDEPNFCELKSLYEDLKKLY